MTTMMVCCKHCSLARGDLRRAIYRANGQVMRYGTADTSEIQRLKAEIAECVGCGGTGEVPGRPLPAGPRAKQPKPVAPPKPPVEIVDPAEVAAALEEAAAKTQQLRQAATAKPQVTGYCHECEKQIVWGRIYCGACTVIRDAGRSRSKQQAS